VARAAADGDVVALGIWNDATAILGATVEACSTPSTPTSVVLGGGSRAPETCCWVRSGGSVRHAMAPARHSADVVLAGLGDEISVVSAATVAFERLMPPPLEGMPCLILQRNAPSSRNIER
jgi:N-acetylglucosamine kinase-like BadF-type ATPase